MKQNVNHLFGVSVTPGRKADIKDILKRCSGVDRKSVEQISQQVNKTIVAPMMRDAVMHNFMSGGVPRFKKNSPVTSFIKQLEGHAGDPLWGTGELFRRAFLDPIFSSTPKEARVSVRATKKMNAYLQTLAEGTKKPILLAKTDKMRGKLLGYAIDAKKANKKNVANILFAAALGKNPFIKIEIPPRPFYNLTDDQRRKLLETWRDKVLEAVLTGGYEDGR